MRPDMSRAKTMLCVLAALQMAGCSVVEDKPIDYKSAGKLPTLEVPPDLTLPSSDNRYAVPDVSSTGSATFSAYSQERSEKPRQASRGLLPEQNKVDINRAGSERWLVVKAKPEDVWPVVLEFWQGLGFIINREDPETGIIETDWAENRAKIPQDMIRRTLGRLIDSVYSTAERDKFRTRLERGSDDTTEIYISHRGMYEVIEGGDGGQRTVWQPREPDPELEAEMLRRLMVRLGVEEERAKVQMAQAEVAPRAHIQKAADGMVTLVLADSFDRAWRRLGLALDRIGFTVEDRNRAEGLYFVRYVDPETDIESGQKGGFLSKLAFWRDSDKKPESEQYRILLKETGQTSEVVVQNADGTPNRTGTAGRIVNLLQEQLK
jgi:outer membrane protein assembly factor BamC